MTTSKLPTSKDASYIYLSERSRLGPLPKYLASDRSTYTYNRPQYAENSSSLIFSLVPRSDPLSPPNAFRMCSFQNSIAPCTSDVVVWDWCDESLVLVVDESIHSGSITSRVRYKDIGLCGSSCVYNRMSLIDYPVLTKECIHEGRAVAWKRGLDFIW